MKTKELILAVPVRFDSIMKQKLRHLLHKSGIYVLQTISSPVLAGIAYGDKYNKEGVTFVCDLDKYNIQFCLIEIRDGVYEVKSVSSIDISEAQLADNNSLTIIGKEIKRICYEIIKFGGILPHIDNIIVCGHNNLSDFVINIIRNNINGDLEIWNNSSAPEIGASIIYDVLKGNRKDVLLLDVINSDIIVKAGDNTKKIIECCTTIPTRKSSIMKLSTSGFQTKIEFNIFEGNDSEMGNNILIGKLVCDDILSVAQTSEEIEVTIDIDCLKNIMFTAKNLTTCKESSLKI